MGYILFAFVLVSFFYGMTETARVHSRAALPSISEPKDETTAGYFLAYRDAVTAYVIANPGVTGAVSWQALGFTELQQGYPVANTITTGTGSNRIAYVWSSIPVSALAQMETLTGGDASLGRVSAGQWFSPSYGPMGTLAINIPNGDVVSVVQIQH